MPSAVTFAHQHAQLAGACSARQVRIKAVKVQKGVLSEFRSNDGKALTCRAL